MTKKIVLIGAGSAMFTQGLVADMIQSPDMGPWELGLVDIDPQALETAEGLSRKMIEAKGAKIAVSASTDRRDVLPGARVVVATVGVGGRRGWEAALAGDRKLFVEALLADGAVTDPEMARKMGEELLEAHRQYLPNFFA